MLASRNYAPSAALADIVARHYIFSVDAPDGFELVDKLLSETAFVRILMRGDWAAQVDTDQWVNVGPMVFFGPNSQPLTVRVRGGFLVIGIAFSPSGWRCLFDEPADRYTDTMLPFEQLWGERSGALHADLATLVGANAADAEIIGAVERHMLDYLGTRPAIAPDAAMARFERLARNDSMMLIRDAAALVGLSSRQMERHCRASFGMQPKTVLRRSRFLDMASAMRGLSQPSAQELAALRYYDQSHRNREFRHFIGMTPGQFEATPTPLLTAGLELRELRKAADEATQQQS